MTSAAPAAAPRTPVRPTAAAPPGRRPAGRVGWPLTALLMGYPLWWALGMGTLIVFVLAVPMAIHLVRRGDVRVPPGFGLWLLFLVWVVASTIMLGIDAPGTLPETAAEKVISVAFNITGYLAVTVALLYLGNLTEREFPRARLVRQLGWLFVFVVAGGLLGTFASTFEFTSPVELLLPRSVAENAFVQSLVHPSAAQLQQVLGYTAGRPAAPFGYTNTWGYVLSLLLGWFAVGWLRDGGWRRATGLVVLALAAIPIVHSLNRGLWIGLGLTALFAVVWFLRNGRLAALVGLLVAVVVAVVLVLASPLMGVVQERLDNPKSDGIRGFTISRTVEVAQNSPVLGHGATRRSLGSSNSIVVGRSAECTNCGNPVLGSNGQLWLLLIAQGFVGAGLYLAYFVRTLWAFRRDRSPLAAGAMLAVLLPFFYMLLYNALVVPLLITFLSIGLLWRNARHAAERGEDEHRDSVPPLPPTTRLRGVL